MKNSALRVPPAVTQVDGLPPASVDVIPISVTLKIHIERSKKFSSRDDNTCDADADADSNADADVNANVDSDEGRTEGQTDGRMNIQTDERTDGDFSILSILSIFSFF